MKTIITKSVKVNVVDKGVEQEVVRLRIFKT
jgi:hypothetical protein